MNWDPLFVWLTALLAIACLLGHLWPDLVDLYHHLTYRNTKDVRNR